MSTSSVALYKTRRILKELADNKGRGTELVSLYVPPKRAIHEVIGALRDEHGTAANIKSDTTRNHVQEALTKTMQRLKLYREAPENGLAMFCGALPTDGPGSEVVRLYEVVPPKPVRTYLYRCDDHFVLDQLRDMLREEKVIGILSLDSAGAGLGVVMGDRLDVEDVMTSGVWGKHRAGGQSARRFERLREMELTYYFNRVAKHSTKVFLEDHQIKGLIVSGPGHTKDEFIKQGFLDYRLQKSVLGMIDTSYAGQEGVRETLGKAGHILEGVRLMEEKMLVGRFLSDLSGGNSVAYGLREVLEALKSRRAESVLVLDDLGTIYATAVCKKCGTTTEKSYSLTEYLQAKQSLLSRPCSSCGAMEHEIEERDVVEVLEDRAVESGAKVEVISSKNEDGAMLKGFGGIAALLRY